MERAGPHAREFGKLKRELLQVSAVLVEVRGAQLKGTKPAEPEYRVPEAAGFSLAQDTDMGVRQAPVVQGDVP